MKKKNKKQKAQRKKQQRVLKSQKRRKMYLMKKNSVETVVVHWDNLNFLENWKSLSPMDLMEKCFQFDVLNWITYWVRPRKDKDFIQLHHIDSLSELLHKTFDDTFDAWNDDTKGFTENLPSRWQYNEKNKNRFISIVKSSLTDEDEITEEDMIVLMENDRVEWFSTVFSDMIDEMVAKLAPYVLSEIKIMSFDA